MMRWLVLGLYVALLGAAPSPDFGVTPRPGAPMPRDLTLVEDSGEPVITGSLLRGRPLVLSFVYFGCPGLCSLALEDLTTAMRSIQPRLGSAYDVAIVSIDPKDTPTAARKHKAAMLEAYGDSTARASLHVLTGSADQTTALANALGIRYAYDAASGQFRHPSVAVVISPGGQAVRYLEGLGLKAQDVHLALADARAERSSSPSGRLMERLRLLCEPFAPPTGRYQAAAITAVRGASLAACLGLVFLITRLVRRRRGYS